MISPQLTADVVQVALLSCGARAGLASGHLARHFGLKAEAVEAVLARGHGVIAPAVSRAAARAALPVLAALGLQVAILPTNAEPQIERFDLSIRLKEKEQLLAARQALKRLGWFADSATVDFRGPAGLEISGLSRSKAEDCVASLGSLRGVSATLSPQAAAKYDVFAPVGGLGGEMARVLKHISVLACSAMDHCPPIAVDLDRHMMLHLLARFPRVGLIGINQAFQRYDLTLTGLGRMSILDLNDFLTTRGLATPDVMKALLAGHGLRLESNLPRPAAKQFVSDYALIGMSVRADLVRA